MVSSLETSHRAWGRSECRIAKLGGKVTKLEDFECELEDFLVKLGEKVIKLEEIGHQAWRESHQA
jgi:hypothetical protein